MNHELLDYIERELAAGRQPDHIVRILEGAGWHRRDISAAFGRLKSPPIMPSPHYRSTGTVRPQEHTEPHRAEQQPSAAVRQNQVFVGPSFLLGRMFALYARRWVPLAILSGMLLAGFFVEAAIAGSLSAFLSGSAAYLSGIRPVIGALFFLAVLGWVLPAMLYVIRDNAGIAEALRLGWRKIIIFWLFVILLAVVTTAGFALFIIPGIIISIWFSVALFVLVYEDRGILSALTMSKEYVRGHWWDVFWVRSFFGFLIGIIVVIVGLGIMVNAILASGMQIFSLIPHISNAFATASGIVDLVSLFFILPLSLIYYFLVYDYLRQQCPNATANHQMKSRLVSLLVILIVLGVLAGWGFTQGIAAIGRSIAANVGNLAPSASLNSPALPHGNPSAGQPPLGR